MKSGFIFHATGAGKTKMALELAQNEAFILVVCPASVRNNKGWLTEAEKFNLRPPDEVISYEGLSKWQPKTEDFVIIFDESHALRGLSVRTKAALSLARKAKGVLCLSGTPADKYATELYYQVKIVAPDALERSGIFKLWQWRAKFCYEERKIINGVRFSVWHAKPDAEARLARAIQAFNFSTTSADPPTLPPLLWEFITVEPTIFAHEMALHGAREFYEDAVQEYPRSYIRRAIHTRGFYSTINGIKPTDTCRYKNDIKAILAKLPQEKIVFVYTFIFERETLLSLLPKDEVAEDIAEFNAGKRFFVIHPRSGGEGLNLQAARIIVFLSLPSSGIAFKQTMARVHRRGQARECVAYIVDYGYETEQLEALDVKLNFNKRFLQAVK